MVDMAKIFSDLQENTMRLYAGEFNEKPERPLLPCLVPTPELLPAPAERDESDTAVCAD